MEITIEEIATQDVKFINLCDGEFIIDGVLRLYVKDDVSRYEIDKTFKTLKRYRD
jgi:hypothetical protein